MGKRVERTRAGKVWTEARYFSFIRSCLRSGMMRYPAKQKVKKAAERTVTGKRHRFEYHCAVCKGWFQGKMVEVDHKVPAGTLKTYDDLPRFVENLYCEPEDMQVLCKPCHQKKTNDERKARKKV